MKLLEESLQTPLFDRNGYMPTLNSVGIAFVKEAHKVLLSYDTLFNSMDEEDDFFGTISLGAVPSAILALVPLSVKSMMKEVTNTKIRIIPCDCFAFRFFAARELRQFALARTIAVDLFTDDM